MERSSGYWRKSFPIVHKITDTQWTTLMKKDITNRGEDSSSDGGMVVVVERGRDGCGVEWERGGGRVWRGGGNRREGCV